MKILPDGNVHFTGHKLPMHSKIGENLWEPDFDTCSHRGVCKYRCSNGNIKHTHYCTLKERTVNVLYCDDCQARGLDRIQ